MTIKFDESGTVEELSKIITELNDLANIESIMVIAGNNKEFTPEKLNPVLSSVSKTVLGAIYTGIIHEKKIYDKGTIVIGFPNAVKTKIITNLSDKEQHYDDAVEDFAKDITPEEYDTMFVLADGYASQLSLLVESLFNIFGVTLNFIGGGAGYYHPEHEMVMKPCVFTNDGIVSNSAVLGLANLNSKISVNHGWTSITESYRVTETDDKKIISIDWQPAFDFYRNILEKHHGKPINRKNFFDIGKNYSLGIKRVSSELIVREPIAIVDNALEFTVPIPNESILYVLTGTSESMVHAATQASRYCTDGLVSSTNKAMFTIDCVSRYYYQGAAFENEISAIKYKDIPLIGALSIGEIANTGKHYIELYNKTCVVGLFSSS